jgi:predicted kinase
MKEMIILRGLPSSGKSSLAKILAGACPSSVICSADNYFVDSYGNYVYNPSHIRFAHQDCQRLARLAAIQASGLIIIDNTNTTEQEYQYYIDLGNQYGYNIRSIVVETTHSNKNDHNVPEKTITKMRNRFKVNL